MLRLPRYSNHQSHCQIIAIDENTTDSTCEHLLRLPKCANQNSNSCFTPTMTTTITTCNASMIFVDERTVVKVLIVIRCIDFACMINDDDSLNASQQWSNLHRKRLARINRRALSKLLLATSLTQCTEELVVMGVALERASELHTNQKWEW